MGRKLTLIVLVGIVGVCISGCSSKEKSIIGKWYCNENNNLLTFYEDHTFDRDILGFNASKDGTYKWYIDRNNLLKVSDLSGTTLCVQEWNKSLTLTDSEWNLSDELRIGDHIYKSVDGSISVAEASQSFFDNVSVICSLGVENEHDAHALQSCLSDNKMIQSVEIWNPEQLSDEFEKVYNIDLDEGIDSNPLFDKYEVRLTFQTEDDLDEFLTGINEMSEVISCTHNVLILDEYLF